MNGNAHFASVGDAPNEAHYEHGVQVIDEDKQFRFVRPLRLSDISHPTATASSWRSPRSCGLAVC